MQTYSHFLYAAVANHQLKKGKNLPLPLRSKALLLGSVMPDMPLFVLSAIFIINNRFIQGNPDIFGEAYDALYFNDPVWIIGHNFFHAPLMVLAMMAVGYQAHRRGKAWGASLFWFAAACLMHSLVDIPTPHNDGPLLLFPFNWELRANSPISYWDPRHYGSIVAPLEHLLDVILIGFLGWTAWRTRQNKKADEAINA
jgi:hypothetical protein